MWNYKKKPVFNIEDIPDYENVVGFVYKITNKISGKFYVGKKSFYSVRKTKIGKREKAETKTRKTFKQKVRESDWKTYTGSSEELLKDLEDMSILNFEFEMLEISYSKKYLSYAEIKHQFLENVLANDSYNGNIMGKFFRRDLQLAD